MKNEKKQLFVTRYWIENAHKMFFLARHRVEFVK